MSRKFATCTCWRRIGSLDVDPSLASKFFSEVFSGGRVGTVSNCTALPCLGRRSASCICTLRCCCQYEVRFHGSRGPQSEYTEGWEESKCVFVYLYSYVMNGEHNTSSSHNFLGRVSARPVLLWRSTLTDLEKYHRRQICVCLHNFEQALKPILY